MESTTSKQDISNVNAASPKCIDDERFIEIMFSCDTDTYRVYHLVPIPPRPLLARKWDYILSKFRVSYTDADGDTITIGKWPELVAAAVENSFGRRGTYLFPV